MKSESTGFVDGAHLGHETKRGRAKGGSRGFTPGTGRMGATNALQVWEALELRRGQAGHEVSVGIQVERRGDRWGRAPCSGAAWAEYRGS